MVERLTGKDAVSAVQLARETGVRQQNLSRWLREARSLPHVATSKESGPQWSVERKAQLLADASKLSGGEELTAYLAEHGVKLAEFEHWRAALQDDNHASTSAGRRIRQLERELARKEKALAEAAALLVLKKRVQSLYPDEGDDTDGPSESWSWMLLRKRRRLERACPRPAVF
jgi:hypothetical protein